MRSPKRLRVFLYRSRQFEVESTPCFKPEAEVESEVNRMPKFVIEREIPGAGKLTPEQLKAVSQTSCGVLREMGPQIQWVQSYVTDNTIYCVYIAPDEATVREHARKGGFPANKVSQVRMMIDPTTSE
jgi:predicted Rdx family selenoprotein